MKIIFLSFFIALCTVASVVAQSDVRLMEGLYRTADGAPFTGEATIEASADGSTQKQRIQVVNGLMDGEISYFNAEGFLEEAGHYSKGKKDGIWTQFSANGKKLGEAFYKDGKKDGIWTVWDENGVKRYHMVYSMGKKIDTWKMWDENATLVSERFYNE
ncbi:MAG: toxin-antitoxin system YwqK family antitoxin [Flavobacteriales bacterium]